MTPCVAIPKANSSTPNNPAYEVLLYDELPTVCLSRQLQSSRQSELDALGLLTHVPKPTAVTCRFINPKDMELPIWVAPYLWGLEPSRYVYLTVVDRQAPLPLVS